MVWGLNPKIRCDWLISIECACGGKQDKMLPLFVISQLKHEKIEENVINHQN